MLPQDVKKALLGEARNLVLVIAKHPDHLHLEEKKPSNSSRFNIRMGRQNLEFRQSGPHFIFFKHPTTYHKCQLFYHKK